MDKETMRKRGWSIHSNSDPASKHPQDQADDQVELHDDDKKTLLDSFPTEELVAMDESDEDELNLFGGNHVRDKSPNGVSTNDGTRNNTLGTAATAASTTNVKSRLSKWAARLFDPDRHRGLIQPPEIIPLNDEFLTAFGKREKDYDDKLGRNIDIDEASIDDDHSGGVIDLTSPSAETKTSAETDESPKVRISNLLFTMSEEILRAACERFGPIREVNLIMDRDQPERNTGRAYVTFETIQAAMACVERLETLGGRKLRVSMVVDTPRRSRKSAGGMGGSMLARYWDKDISTKCFRCGEVGHMEASCPNEARPKPCPLCALPGHDMRNCAISRICFRCGIPGHINRDCTYNYNLPKRMVCGICFQSGHHRTSCRRSAQDAPSQDARCMVCHKIGHFLCTDMKWFFGLEGMTCFNCGRSGHHGYDCKRPTVDMCSRDEGLAAREIERAAADSLTDELSKQRKQRGRDNHRGRDDSRNQQDRQRAKSQGPLNFRGRGYAPSRNETPRSGKRRSDAQNHSDNRNSKERRR